MPKYVYAIKLEEVKTISPARLASIIEKNKVLGSAISSYAVHQLRSMPDSSSLDMVRKLLKKEAGIEDFPAFISDVFATYAKTEMNRNLKFAAEVVVEGKKPHILISLPLPDNIWQLTEKKRSERIITCGDNLTKCVAAISDNVAQIYGFESPEEEETK
jgi:hypothetical protein